MEEEDGRRPLCLAELLKIQRDWQVRKVLALIVNRSQVGSGPSP